MAKDILLVLHFPLVAVLAQKLRQWLATTPVVSLPEVQEVRNNTTLDNVVKSASKCTTISDQVPQPVWLCPS